MREADYSKGIVREPPWWLPLAVAAIAMLGGWSPEYFKSALFTFLAKPVMRIMFTILAYLGIFWFLWRSWVGRFARFERLRPAVKLILCVLFGLQMGWTRFSGLLVSGGEQLKLPSSKTVVEMLPEEVLALAHRSPRSLPADKYELWRTLTPCLKLDGPRWITENDAIFEVREAIKESTGREVSDGHVFNSIKARAKKGSLSVRFRRFREGNEHFRILPIDSIDIVFGVDQNGRVLEPDKLIYVRDYWSGDICFIEWE